jgi:hypothetical protein
MAANPPANLLRQKLQLANTELKRIDQITKQIDTYNPDVLPRLLKQQIERLRSDLVGAERRLRAAQLEHEQLVQQRDVLQQQVNQLVILQTTLQTLKNVALKWTNVLNEFTSARLALS